MNKKILQITTIILLLVPTISNAQFSYSKLVAKNKTNQAFEKAKKKIQSNPNDISALYDLSTLFIIINKENVSTLTYAKLKYNTNYETK